MSKTSDKLTNELLYLYNTGKLYHAYRTFGAHIEDGGVQFTLWAPDVRSVSVTGDFNGWGTYKLTLYGQQFVTIARLVSMGGMTVW